MQIKKVFFKELEVKVLEGVYEPKEDGFLIASVLEKQELNGKKVLDFERARSEQKEECRASKKLFM